MASEDPSAMSQDPTAALIGCWTPQITPLERDWEVVDHLMFRGYSSV